MTPVVSHVASWHQDQRLWILLSSQDLERSRVGIHMPLGTRDSSQPLTEASGAGGGGSPECGFQAYGVACSPPWQAKAGVPKGTSLLYASV